MDRGDDAHGRRRRSTPSSASAPRRPSTRAAAIPILDLLEANDDAIQARSLLAGHAIAEGRFDEAERLIAEIERARAASARDFGGAFVTGTVRAELALARGEIAEGLRLYRVAGDELASITLPGHGAADGLEPWALFGDAAGATAYAAARHRRRAARTSSRRCAPRRPEVLDPERPRMDYPVAGLVLHGLGAWGLLREAIAPEDAVRLLVLAELFAYPRYTATMDPDAHRGRGRAGRARAGRPASGTSTAPARARPPPEARAVTERIAK